MEKDMESLKKIIIQEITKAEIRDMISTENQKLIKSRDFEKKVKELSAKVIEELYKILWTRKGFWSDSISK